jgi:hypothetical protein
MLTMQQPNVRYFLASVLKVPPSQADATALVDLFHKIALAYLRTKSISGRFDATRFGLTLDDLAYDAIADLFARDDAGIYSAIRSFVERIGPLESLSDDDLILRVRRLVFGAVNQQVFRLYGSFDPSLAKVIRNIKLALKHHPVVTVQEQHGEAMIFPNDRQFLNQDLPVMAPEFLLPELYDRISATSKLKDMLSALGAVLCEQQSYRKAIPLVEFAILVRTMYASNLEVQTETSPEATLSDNEIERMINKSVALIKETTAAAYVSKRKLTEEDLRAHLDAVRDILSAEFIGENGQSKYPAGQSASYYQIIMTHMKSLTPELYRSRHRVILEYFAKLARNDLKVRLKHEF